MKKLFISIVTLLLPVLLLTSCATKPQSADVIKVGSKNFTESLILSEIYSLALEDAGYQVKRVSGISSSVIHTAIVDGEIDLYPEYTGTGLIAILKLAPITDPQKVYDTVKTEYQKQFNIAWLDYSKANDGQGLVMNKKKAEELGITNLSELQQNAKNIRFASQGEFDIREDGLPMLENVYGKFDFASKEVFDNGLKYDVLKNDKADLATAYTTEGQLEGDNFLLLDDDKKAWPPYNIAPIIKQNVLDKNPKIKDILNKVTATLDTKIVTSLNAKVDVHKEEFEDVAKSYYEEIRSQVRGD